MWRGLRGGMPGLPTVPEREPAEQCAPETSRPGFVLGLDVGSSVIRCHVYDRAGRIRGSSAQKVTGSGRRGRGSGSHRFPGSGRARKRSGRVRLIRPGRGHLQHPGA